MERKILLEKMSSFDREERMESLREAARAEQSFPTPGKNVNMHIHSFFSYNAFNYSPARLAWEMRKKGLYAAALCDFDVLDGMDEFLLAGRILDLRTAVHLETRVFFPEMSEVDITSPGEPGVTYMMGAGFSLNHPKESEQEKILASLRGQAEKRNRRLVERINNQIPDLSVDYERDVLPLTPAGCATERHIIRAYVYRAERLFPELKARAAFWTDILGKAEGEENRLLSDRPLLEEAVRARLVKRGGIGYLPPTTGAFPPIDRFIKWVLSCKAIPMATWLDGCSRGEENPAGLLEILTSKGVAAVNIIPDRNWNITDKEQQTLKRQKLKHFVETAVDFRLPINIGTEMNKRGRPFTDNLDGEALRAYREVFLKGARIMVGHSILLKHAGFSFTGVEAQSEFGDDRKRKNNFFEAVGALPPLGASTAESLEEMGVERAFSVIRDSVKTGNWAL